MERRGGMVNGKNGDGGGVTLSFSKGLRLAVRRGDTELRKEMTKRMPSERNDYSGSNERELEHEPRHTLLLLLRSWFAILRRSVFDDV